MGTFRKQSPGQVLRPDRGGPPGAQGRVRQLDPLCQGGLRRAGRAVLPHAGPGLMAAPNEPLWRRYLRFFGPDVDADVDEELRFHLEMRERSYLERGLS